MDSKNHPAIEPAFVLNRRPYRETSLLLEAFTARSGRIGLVARGARRGKTPLASVLEPFRPLLLSWRGTGELFTLTLAEADDSARLSPTPPVKSGFYVNELLLRLLHRHDPYPSLFENYREVLESIRAPEREELALRVFEKRLLAAIGYGLSLDRDADSSRPVVREKRYRYQPGRGFVEQNGVSGGGMPTAQGSTLIALDRETLQGAEQLREAKYLMRAILQGYLGGKPLMSRMLYR
uniref:DNA repair protein RecO n=1 Tax=Candidatus Kentrum eta TaxID=2126337 RepID=A0A450VHF2_9GAMM|nr:MAG: DNA replication and repair protein RecO [Candidatus Kentron sp. H]VFJ99709.1 MAG: DNA replication and repair protein RecO [Candidatus Kentron sp. H]VFK04170.1 MAG: DNA replication and repair protein RecO [Candidatus Kentron sp. H]